MQFSPFCFLLISGSRTSETPHVGQLGYQEEAFSSDKFGDACISVADVASRGDW
jgi:hypothetical protein